MFTLHHVSHVTCHVSHVRCQIFCFTKFLVSITSVGHIVPVYKAMILWAGLQCILSVPWVITKKSYHPKTKMKKSSRIQIPCKHWSTALRTNLCKIVSKTNTSRAGLQCFLSVPWVITNNKQNYHPSTKTKHFQNLKTL